MAKDISGINTIKYGELHIYYPLQFNTSLSYDQICKYIINRTVYEQISIFEKMMSHYLKPELTSEKLSAIDNILREKELKKKQCFSKFYFYCRYAISHNIWITNYT